MRQCWLRPQRPAATRGLASTGGSRPPRTIIVDATPLAYRAHFGYAPKGIKLSSSPQGANTTAISGAINMLLTYIRELQVTPPPPPPPRAALMRAGLVLNRGARGRPTGWRWCSTGRAAGRRERGG